MHAKYKRKPYKGNPVRTITRAWRAWLRVNAPRHRLDMVGA